VPALQALGPNHKDYPVRLNDLAEPPKSLYVRGSIGEGPCVAIVGSRRADRFGLRFAHELAADLARAEVTVISGGARGIDQAAHWGAIEGGYRTIMVLGCGLDVDYPKGTGELRRKTIERGAVISELPPDAKPHPGHFPRRNRIVAALTQAVVVVQAGQRSGALITARLARELGREVFAVPGRPRDELTRGTHDLLRRGASMCEGAGDVLEKLGFDVADTGQGLRRESRITNLTGLPAAVARALRRGPASAEELARGLERPVGELMATLLHLEVDGVVVNVGGSYELR
jgi:DNA processing protein